MFFALGAVFVAVGAETAIDISIESGVPVVLILTGFLILATVLLWG